MTTQHITWTVNHALQSLGYALPGLAHTGLLSARDACPVENVELLRKLRYSPDDLALELFSSGEQAAAEMVARLVLTGATLSELLNVTGEGV